jgi:predicted TIM-barrel fold metal-dependent hydrolase
VDKQSDVRVAAPVEARQVVGGEYPNVFIDTSAYKVSRYPKELVDYMRGSARHRILFGSNHPFWPPGECIAGLDALDLGEAAKAAFLAGNAQRVFKLN